MRVNEAGSGSAGTRQTASEVNFFDNLVGIHGVCESIACEFQNVGQIELINEYSRMVKAEQSATNSLDEISNTSSIVISSNCSNLSQTSLNVKGIVMTDPSVFYFFYFFY